MKSTFAWSLALGFAAALAACGNGGSGSGATTAAADTAAATTSSPATTATATAPATAPATETPTATATASADPSATASAAASGAPAASGTAAASAKKYDCGEKGQKQCPMQGWMKSAMGSAVASGDGERIARNLDFIGSHPPPGMAGAWNSISATGAVKARAGDIDGAKQACKQCHDKFKSRYVASMRDMKWP